MPYPVEMQESVKKVETTRPSRLNQEFNRLELSEKARLLEDYHPDYRPGSKAPIPLGPNSDDHSGDPVLIWGEELPVEDIARRAGILAYQLVCGVMHRENSSISR